MTKSVDKATFYYLTKRCLFRIPPNMKPDNEFMTSNDNAMKGECKLGSGKQQETQLGQQLGAVNKTEHEKRD